MNRLTVVMPVYNAENYLSQALESILNQTYKDFVLFVIDDGSTDKSAEIIKLYQEKDPRIVFFSQENRGLITTLNNYFVKSETEYVARMDADDISLPSRLKTQIEFLDNHKGIGIVGTGVQFMDESLSRIIEESIFPADHCEILWKMLYTSGFSHPSIMLRKNVFLKVGGYAKDALHVEDYDFFLRAKEVTRFANLQERLFIYRKNEQSVSHLFSRQQKLNHFNLSIKSIQELIPLASNECIRFLKYDEVTKESDFMNLYSFLEQLYSAFILKHNPTGKEKLFIRHDWIRKLRILVFSARRHSPWIAIKLYFRTLLKGPLILLFNR